MPENNGATNGASNLETAMAQAVSKLLARKVAIICFAMYVIWGIAQLVLKATDPVVRYCLMAFAGMVCLLAIIGFRGQMWLDHYEIEKTGKDQSDNGNGGTVTT
jgi:uncharacterized membrane protein YqjE